MFVIQSSRFKGEAEAIVDKYREDFTLAAARKNVL